MAANEQEQQGGMIIPWSNFVLKFANTNINRAVTIDTDTQTIIPLNLRKKIITKIWNENINNGG